MANRSDDFNRSDSTTSLGSPSDGGAAWSVLRGTWGISSNRGYKNLTGTGSGIAAAVLDSASADVTVVATIAVVNVAALVVRAADSANLVYGNWDNLGTLKIWKLVAGSATQIGTTASGITISAGDTLTLAVDSSDNYDFQLNGVSKVTGNDSAGNTNTLHGLGNASSTTRYDDFSITNAAGGSSLDIAGSATASLSGTVTPSGDIQFTVPFDLAASAAAALTGTVTVSGDLQFPLTLDISAAPISLSGTFSATGDLDPYPKLDLAGAQSAALTGTVSITGDIQSAIPFDLAGAKTVGLSGTLTPSGDLQFGTAFELAGTAALSGTLAVAGDLQYSSAAPYIAPSAQTAYGGGGGAEFRKLIKKLEQDIDERVEPKKAKASPAAPTPTPKSKALPQPSTQAVAPAAAPAVSVDLAPSLQALASQLSELLTVTKALQAEVAALRSQRDIERGEDEERAVVTLLLS